MSILIYCRISQTTKRINCDFIIVTSECIKWESQTDSGVIKYDDVNYAITIISNLYEI